jgi:N-acylneuraminate cytidylyltransferase
MSKEAHLSVGILFDELNMAKSVAIITARGGSKRIPQKNIRDFLGKPIIAYSISAALDSKCFNEVMVSTDDRDIREIAIAYGAQVPFYRSANTSDDNATSAEVLNEVLEEYRARGKDFNYACCIYPTAPFVTPEKLIQGFNLLIENDADSAFPVVRFNYPIQRALKVEKHKLVMFWPEHLNSRSQDLIPAYHDAGQFYWFNVERFMLAQKLFTDNSFPILMPEIEVQDIDNEEDWKIAEMKYQFLKLERN